LIVEAPADGTAITIEEIAGPVDLPDGLETLATYEFGPDGATFDPPLAVSVELDVNIETDGIAITHVSSDGASEPIEFDFTASGVAFELSSFSAVHVGYIEAARWRTFVALVVPDRVPVPEKFPIELQAVTPVGPLALDFEGTFKWSAPLDMFEDNVLTCSSVGFGKVSVDGPLRVFVDETHLVRIQRAEAAEATVECYKAETTLLIEPPDSDNAEPLDFEVAARSPLAIAVPTAAIPQGGWIGLSIETATTFVECAIADSREQDIPKSGCTTFDGALGTQVPIATTIEGEHTWLEIPTDSYQVKGGTLQWLVDGEPQPVTFMNLNVFPGDGSRKQGIILIDQVLELLVAEPLEEPGK
jgi:hypothetical protein